MFRLLKVSVSQDKSLSVTSKPREDADIPQFHIVHTRIERKGHFKAAPLNAIIEADIAIQNYFAYIANRKGNDGIVPYGSRKNTLTAFRRFMEYTNLEITDHTVSDLIAFKLANPNNHKIELALQSFSNENSNGYHLKCQRHHADKILGVFHHNYAPLQVSINTHFDPVDENCTEGIFQDIYNHLTPYQKTMMQWMQYTGERATAVYKIPLEQIDLSRSDVAILNIKTIQTKSRIKHPCFIPIEFARQVIRNAIKAKRTTPFPDHESQWKLITRFAKEEYQVRLTSHYLRKRFETIAESTPMNPNHYAYLMGEQMKVGHMANIYSLKTTETLIQEYTTYLSHALSLGICQTNDIPSYAAHQQSAKPTSHHNSHNEEQPFIQSLQQTIQQQAEQIKILTNLLKQRS